MYEGIIEELCNFDFSALNDSYSSQSTLLMTLYHEECCQSPIPTSTLTPTIKVTPPAPLTDTILSCDEIRTRITTFLSSHVMSQHEFLKIMECNSDSLQRFMKLRGKWNGTRNQIYLPAQKFFVSGEDKTKKRKCEEMETQQQSQPEMKLSHYQLKVAKQNVQLGFQQLFDEAQQIILPLEGEGKVPVYDNCDEIRQKSQTFIEECGIRTSHWLRLIGNVNKKSWSDFIGYSGPQAGAANRSYYAAYVFLEKIRIARNEEKWSNRTDAEAEFGISGRPLIHILKSQEIAQSHLNILNTAMGIKLDEERQNRLVAVYDSCDQVRKKSLELIKTFGIKVNEWIGYIGNNANVKLWKDFLHCSGESAGVHNRCYYGAYVFLEKVRVVMNEEKSEARLIAEQHYGESGRSLLMKKRCK